MHRLWSRIKCWIGFHRFVHENVMASMSYRSDIEVCTRCFYERVIRGPL